GGGAPASAHGMERVERGTRLGRLRVPPRLRRRGARRPPAHRSNQTVTRHRHRRGPHRAGEPWLRARRARCRHRLGAARGRGLRTAPLVRTIVAYVGHSWELFILRAWLAAFLAAAFALRGLSPTDASATASQWAALLLALGVPGVFVGGWLSDRVGRLRAAILYALGSGALSVGFGTLLFAPWPAIVAIGGLYGALVA